MRNFSGCESKAPEITNRIPIHSRFNDNRRFALSRKFRRTFHWTPREWFSRWKIIRKRAVVPFATRIAP